MKRIGPGLFEGNIPAFGWGGRKEDQSEKLFSGPEFEPAMSGMQRTGINHTTGAYFVIISSTSY
jgi:hypothetical protein